MISKSQYDSLELKYIELKQKYDEAAAKLDQYEQKLSELQSIDHNLNEVVNHLNEHKLNSQQYSMLMDNVLTNVRKGTDGHLIFNTTRHTVHAVVCRIFNGNNTKNPFYECLKHHVRNM